jgi:hypothetical protein
VSAPAERAVVAALAPLDRRAFLRLAGGVAASGLLPTGCGRMPEGLLPPPDRLPRVLSLRSYATFQAFTMRLVGPRGAAAIAAREIDPAAAADAWVFRLPALGMALGQALALLEWGVWPLLPKLRPFTSLDAAGQDRVLEDLVRSRMDVKRDLYKGLKSLATLTTFGHPVARAWLGHPGPFSAEGIRAAMTWSPEP